MRHIDGMVGAKAKFPARFQLGGDQIYRAIVHHSPFYMARLWPRVRVEQIGHGKRAVGDAPQHVQCIAVVDADIGNARFDGITRNLCERHRHAIKERLAPDKAVVGEHVCPLGHMFATAKADLKMERTIIFEQRFGRYFSVQRHGDLGEQSIDQMLLKNTQRLAL